jgi:uncharacterized protein DUF6585
MKVLGAPLRHFASNKMGAVWFGVGALILTAVPVAGTTVLQGAFTGWEELGAIVGAAAMAGLCAWWIKSSVTICQNGLRYTGLTARGEMLWEDVETVRLAIIKHYARGVVPMGTTYQIFVKDITGRCSILGNNIDHPEELIQLLHRKLDPVLLQKMTAAYDNGKLVDMGAVKVAHDHIQIWATLQIAKIPIFNVAGCSINDGKMRIAEKKDGKIRQYETSITHVENAFPLMELINTRIVPKALAATTH